MSPFLNGFSLLSFKRLPRITIIRNLFKNSKEKEERRAEILGDLKKGFLADLKEVKETGGKRYLALSEPFPQKESHLLPSIYGTSLAGDPVVLPQDVLSQVSLLLLWTRDYGQRTCDTYREVFTKEFLNARDTACYEVNIIDSWLGRLFKTSINKNLKKQIPLDRQDKFLCCYDHPTEFIIKVFENTLVGHVLLVDHAGLVRWKAHGKPTDEELLHLVNCTNTLRREIPKSEREKDDT